MPLAAQAVERGEQVVDDLRREAERRLVEQQDARPRHQAAGDRQHLLLAAREQARALVQPLAQARKALQHRLDVRARVGARRRNAPSRMLSSTLSSGNTWRPSGTSTTPRATTCSARRARSAPRRREWMPPRTGAVQSGERRASASTCRRRWRRARRPPRPGAPAGRCRAAPAPRRSRRRAGRPQEPSPAPARARGSARPAEALRRGRPRARRRRPGSRPGVPAARRCPASSTTTWSEMPITSAMSCSTSSTATPASAMRRSSARQPRLVVAREAGRGLVEQQRVGVGRERARDLDQAPVDVRRGRRRGRRGSPA